jgi:zinc/manganese transport system permease protein
VSAAGLDAAILLPGLAAGLVVVATHVPLGREVLRRGIIFLDLAVAQLAGLGMIAAHAAGLHAGPGVVLAGLATAVAGGALLSRTERLWPDRQEALIGVTFVLAACAALLLLAGDPRGAEHLHDLIAGQILWLNWTDVGSAFLLALPVLLIWFGWPGVRSGVGFYLLFALTITMSVQLVGVYLVFASLILPALAIPRASGTFGLCHGWGVGIAGYALGLALSALADWPSGPTLVWTLATCTVLSLAGQRFLTRRA